MVERPPGGPSCIGERRIPGVGSSAGRPWVSEVEPSRRAGRPVSVGSDPSETKVPRSSPAPIAGGTFEAFYRTRWLPTVRLARMILGSTEEAEELSQEALIRVHERWGSLERPDSFLYIVTVNLCRSQVRRRGWR